MYSSTRKDEMKIPRFRNVTFCLLDEEEASLRAFKQHLHWTIHYFTRRKLIQALIKTHAKKTGLRGTIFMRAHGRATAPEYQYVDHGKVKCVQDWVDTHDGKFNLLIVGSCNEQNYSIRSEKSIVIHPNCSLSLKTMMLRRGGYSRVYVPVVGYVEHNPRLIKRVTKVFLSLC